jgi:hypothetical protein
VDGIALPKRLEIFVEIWVQTSLSNFRKKLQRDVWTMPEACSICSSEIVLHLEKDVKMCIDGEINLAISANAITSEIFGMGAAQSKRT